MDPMGDTSLDTFTYYPNNQDLFFHCHGGNKIDPSSGEVFDRHSHKQS